MRECRQRAISRVRDEVWQAICDLLVVLESRCPTELEAVECFVDLLRKRGIARQWYGSGSLTGYEDRYQGTIVVFDDPSEPHWLGFSNARRLEPRQRFHWKGLGYFYASPLIYESLPEGDNNVFAADFGVTLYTGHRSGIQSAFIRRMNAENEILRQLRSGHISSSGELYEVYEEVANRFGLYNVARSSDATAGQAHTVNIGHTLHCLHIDKDADERLVFEKYSEGRRFIHMDGNDPLQGEIWTLESRDVLIQQTGLVISFHEAIDLTHSGCELLTSAAECARREVMPWLTS